MTLVCENSSIPIRASREFERMFVTVESLNKYIPRRRDCEAVYGAILSTVNDGEKRSIFYSVRTIDGGIEPRRIDLIRNFRATATGSICKAPFADRDLNEKTG